MKSAIDILYKIAAKQRGLSGGFAPMPINPHGCVGNTILQNPPDSREGRPQVIAIRINNAPAQPEGDRLGAEHPCKDTLMDALRVLLY
jgi:hypothetical protein